LSRKAGEKIVINDDLEVTILEIRGKNIKVGLTAPDSYVIVRGELQSLSHGGKEA